jgi:HAD superfamily hydrolase (TIGR01549 family)
MIKAILFDLGGTLVKNFLNPYETFQKILEMKRIHVTISEIEKAFSWAENALGAEFLANAWKMPSYTFYETWNSHVLKGLHIDTQGAWEINNYWLSVSGLALYPDVTPVIAALPNVKTGIISNAYQHEIVSICDTVNLHGFDIVVGMDTAQSRKPDPYIFLYAVENLGITPGEAVYVGNDVEKDYRGAEKVGMHPLLIVREGEVPHNIKSIKSLLSLMEYLDT